jgi:DNA-binding MarR family transcriptional regulator
MAKKKINLDEELLKYRNPRNMGRLLNVWRRYFEDWAHTQLEKRGHGFFKIGYMPFIMNISPGGSTNNEIAAKGRVTKQAMSKVVKQLLAHGFIRNEKHGEDGRASLIFLTNEGKEFVIEAKKCVLELEKEYRGIVGDEEYEAMIDTLYKIVEYHEQKGFSGKNTDI